MSNSLSEFDEPSEFVAAEGSESALPLGKQQSLGKAAGHGFSWFSISIIVGKVLNFLTQLVLGAILLDEEFGIFAIASSIAVFLRVFNDGGVAHVLVQRGKSQFDRLAGPAFWISMCFSLATGLLMAAITPLAVHLYGNSQLAPLMYLLAVTIPLSCPATILKAKLRVELRFQTIAWISVSWFLIRQSGTIILALLGYGAMSFVIPLPFVTLLELVAVSVITRITPWKGKIRVSQWPEILGSSFWVAFAAFLRGLSSNGDYIVLGLLVPTAILGQYFFGYQLTVQFAVLMAANIQYVLFPVMSHLASEPARQARAIVRTIRLMTLVAAPFSLIVAATISSIEALAWQEKWAAAVPLMQIFSVAAPLRLISEIVHAAIMSRGQFRRSAKLRLFEALLLMFSAWFAVRLFGANLTQIALLIAASQATFSVVLTLVVLRGYGIRPADVWRAFLPAWITATAVAALTVAVSGWYLNALPQLVRLLLETCLFSGGFLLLARMLFSKQLEELASVVPGSLKGLVRRVFLLKQIAAGSKPIRRT